MNEGALAGVGATGSLLQQGHALPVIELWGVLLVPLQGDITDGQMGRVADEVLDRLRRRGARGLVLDASGVWLVDSHLCAALARLAAAAKLMGVPSVLCGLGPDVVLTLLEMGFEPAGVRTALGLEEALEALGARVRFVTPEHDGDGDDGDDDGAALDERAGYDAAAVTGRR